jgi:hypothetical protein
MEILGYLAKGEREIASILLRRHLERASQIRLPLESVID